MIELPSLNRQEQIQRFKERGMQFKNEKAAEEKLKHISYYRLKEYAFPLSFYKDGHTDYHGIYFSEVLARYYQDKNLRIYLLHAIEKIEISLKTNIGYILGEKYGPYGYLKFANWVNRQRYGRDEVEEREIFLKKNLRKIMRKSQLASLSRAGNINEEGYPSVWLGVDLLMFGDLVSIVQMMNQKSLRELADYYQCTTVELISWLKCLNFVRNVCAHHSNLIDLTLKTRAKSRSEWNLFLADVRSGQKPTNRFSVIFLIVHHFVSVINVKYNWSRIVHCICSLSVSDSRARLLGFKNKETSKKLYSDL